MKPAEAGVGLRPVVEVREMSVAFPGEPPVIA